MLSRICHLNEAVDVVKSPLAGSTSCLRGLQPLLATTGQHRDKTNHITQAASSLFEVDAVRFLEGLGTPRRPMTVTAAAGAHSPPTKQASTTTPNMSALEDRRNANSSSSSLHSYLQQCMQTGMEPDAAHCNQALLGECAGP